jgi:hypothetical protein
VTETPVDNVTETPVDNVTETPVEETPTEIPSEDVASVEFADQMTNGTTVTVESADVPAGGFVAIHNESLFEGDAIGSLIGVSDSLGPGLSQNITVTLFDVPGANFTQTTLAENQTLVAMAHQDTNANILFDFVTSNGTEDVPYTVTQPVTDSASVSVAPANVTTPVGTDTPAETETPLATETPTETETETPLETETEAPLGTETPTETETDAPFETDTPEGTPGPGTVTPLE